MTIIREKPTEGWKGVSTRQQPQTTHRPGIEEVAKGGEKKGAWAGADRWSLTHHSVRAFLPTLTVTAGWKVDCRSLLADVSSLRHPQPLHPRGVSLVEHMDLGARARVNLTSHSNE